MAAKNQNNPSPSQPIQPATKLGSFNSAIKQSHFSTPQLAIFVIVFGVIGFLIYKSFAAAPLITSMEAEQMVLPAGASVITDSTASAGKAVLLSSNGTTTGSVNFPSAVTSYTLMARGSQCSGAPAVTVKLDSTNLLTATAVSSTSWTAYTYTLPNNTSLTGTHSLAISFTNDYSQSIKKHHNASTCSRDLYLDVSNFYGPTPPPTPAPTVSLSSTPASVTAGQASILTWNSTNATSCTASGAWSGTQPTSGSLSTGALNQNSTYTLACSGAGGTTSASSTATVVTPTSSIKIGETNVLATVDNGNANLLVAQSAILSQAATIQSLSFYVNNAAGKLRLGIYDSTGPNGGPGNKLAETSETIPVSGWNTANVNTVAVLPAGTYWIAYLSSDNNLGFNKTSDSSSSGRFYSFNYGALPAVYSTAPTQTSSHWSFYATLNTTGTPPPPPTTSSKLMWAPPALTNPITIKAPTTGPWQPQLNAGQDYIIKMPSTVMTSNSTNGSPAIVLNGGRNIVIIGGELYRANTVPPGSSGDAIGIEIASGVTGTVHIEGLYIHGMWGQGIQFAMQSATTHPEVQIENTRIEAMHPTQYASSTIPANAEVHTDAIQSYGGPYKLRLDHVTLRTTGTGLQIQPHNLQTASPIGTWEFHHVDVIQTIGQYGNYALWKNFDQPQNWPIVQSDLYVSNQAYLAWANEDNYPVGWNRWNPGGDWPVTGEAWNKGLRPSGDLVLSTSVGGGYTSPGYQ